MSKQKNRTTPSKPAAKAVVQETELADTLANQTSNKYAKWLILLIVLVTTVVYFKSLDNELTNWDDKGYLNENQPIKQLHGDSVAYTIKYLFDPANPQMGNYHPLTMLSYAIEYSKYQLDPKPYHVTNLLFHLFNSVLVFLLIMRLVKLQWVAFVTALLFAIHPMHVESVAWVSERKDVLYGCFFLLSILFYLKAIAIEQKNKILFFILAIICFVLSAFSKGMAVSLPIALITIDYFLKRKFTFSVWMEKVPFLIIAVIFGLITIKSQQTVNAIGDLNEYSFGERILFTCYGISAYLWKFIAPFNLSCFYDYPKKGTDGMYPPMMYFTLILVVALFIWVFRSMRKGRTIAFGIGFFLVTIALVLQILPVGEAIIAERYTYIPYIGIAFILGQGIQWLITSTNERAVKFKMPVLGGLAVIAVLFSVLAHQRTMVWKDSITLWNDAIAKDNTVARQYKCRGDAYMNMQPKFQYARAIKDYDSTVSLNVYEADAYFNRGLCYQSLEKIDSAVMSYELACQYKPTVGKFHGTLGLAYFYQKRYDKALESYNKSLELEPTAAVYNNRAGVHYFQQNFTAALSDAENAIKYGYAINPAFIKELKDRIAQQQAVVAK